MKHKQKIKITGFKLRENLKIVEHVNLTPF